jgi:NTE family protein
MTKKVDAVFEGGGVKGIGLIGALTVVEENGYGWGNLAGTSAGAIVASLVAAGYRAPELKTLVGGLDYNKFKQETVLDRVPILGPLLNLILKRGVYSGDYLENWIGECLAAKGIKTFGQLVVPGETEARYRYKLQVITSDITSGSLVILPQGLSQYGIDPDSFPVAQAVRMSMSIPFFFESVRYQNADFVDGGILSNFPVWLFDSPGIPEWPTFGFKFVEPEDGRPNSTKTPFGLAKAVFSTMMEAHDKLHVENEDFLRTIAIPTLGVQATDFGLSGQRCDALFQSGRQAALEFFKTWDFQSYVRQHRTQRDPNYLIKINKLKRDTIGARESLPNTSTTEPVGPPSPRVDAGRGIRGEG